MATPARGLRAVFFKPAVCFGPLAQLAKRRSRNAPNGSAFTMPRCDMASNFLCFIMGAVAPLSLVSWLIAFH